MPNTKSAARAHRRSLKRRMRNKSIKTFMKNLEKKLRSAIEAKNEEEARNLLNLYYKHAEKTATKGVWHKNKAARKKSRLTLLFNKMFQAGVAQ